MAADEGYVLGSKAIAQIQRLIREDMRRLKNETPQSGRYSQTQRHVQVMMKADLLAAVDCQTDPSTAAAYVMRRTSGGDLETTDREITIVNRFQEISVDAGMYAKAEWIDGEWQLYAADCATDASFSTGDVVSE